MEVMNVEQLAAYLERDARDLRKWASRGYIPAQKVGGEWRFHRAEIHHWLETQMHAYTEQELLALERGGKGHQEEEPLLALHLSEATISLPLAARSKSSVLRALVETAERSWHVYDPAAILDAIRAREQMCATALPSGVAIPHPRRPLSNALEDHVIAYGRTPSGIPFGGADGALTDIFFLVLSRDDRTHLKILARLSRLLLRPEFVDELRGAETPAETLQLIESAEKDVIG